jgi:methyltransferase (TIGR00027 family)
MVGDFTQHLAVTARFTAAARAQESARPDALFRDPFAADFAGVEGQRWLAQLRPEASLWPIIRTRFLDDLARSCLADHPVAQVVLVGAGFDARAYRLGWPVTIQVFELDQTVVLDEKARVLRAIGATCPCRRTALNVDLRQAWGKDLLGAGFCPDMPALWLVEGLFMYLDETAAQHLLAAVSALAAPASVLGLDIPMHSLRGNSVTDPVKWLHPWGWEAAVETLGDAARRYGRWPPLPGGATGDRAQLPVFLVAAQKL